jgi:amino acid transporter
MSLKEFLLGKPIPDDEADEEKIGPAEGVAVLGLDALASSAYGPEAALTVLLAAGAGGTRLVGPIVGAITAVLGIVYLSYRQTIAAYPDGGGAYSVAHENLGPRAGVLAAAALSLDYVLNVAVAISAGVGALVSTEPRLLPYTLPLCLALLGLLALVNLRGIRTAGALFLVPTYAFIACLGSAIAWGVVKSVLAGGAPQPVVAPASLRGGTAALGVGLVLRAFANGCTAMTGVEAVSNAVPVFREPRTRTARRTLGTIVAVLAGLLAGIAFLSHAYGIGATEPGREGYQSVLSQVVAAVAGRGAFYYVTMATIVAVLCLSANTSFADFPRVCRVLALDGYLPPSFAHAGRRLVYTTGILALSALSGLLLVAFHGITDRLIPLFAVGALGAFTMSQAGMVAHWRRQEGPHRRRAAVLNGVGAVATGATLLVVVVSKFTEGAWMTVIFIPLVFLLLQRTSVHHARIRREAATSEPFTFSELRPPVVVVPVKLLDRVARKALRFALSISPEVHAVHVVRSDEQPNDVSRSWPELVERPAREAGLPVPRLATVRSTFRQVVDPLLAYVKRLAREDPDRFIAVLVPELVERRWYHYVLHNHTATMIKMLLLFRGGPQVVIIDAPWHLRERRVGGRARRPAARVRAAERSPA